MKLVPGLIINNRYHLMRIIATGGMGEMWLANDNVLSREVAIKALREENAGNEDFLQRLRIEARNNAILTHPNIVSLHDYTEDSGIGFIVMEYIEGRSLADLLRSKPILELSELLPILIQISRALGFAHKQGIIHRDIKPANILLDANNNVKVVDFGVSKAMNQINMTAAGMVVGTAQYLSPEQAIGDAATGASDLYALGVIAFEASQGRRPFSGKNAVDIAIAQVNNPVPPMSDTTNLEFQKIVLNLLEKNVLNRAVDGDKVADDFLALLQSLDSSSKSAQSDSSSASTKITSQTKEAPNGQPAYYQLVQTSNSPAKRISHQKTSGGRHADKRNFISVERNLKNASTVIRNPNHTGEPPEQQLSASAGTNLNSQNAPSRTTSRRYQTAKLRSGAPKMRHTKRIRFDKVAILLITLITVITLLIILVSVNIAGG
jgi:serine/threonine-protein kinase